MKSCTCHQVTRRDLQDLSLEVLNAMQNGRIVTDSHTRSTVQVPGALSLVILSRRACCAGCIDMILEMHAPLSFPKKCSNVYIGPLGFMIHPKKQSSPKIGYSLVVWNMFFPPIGNSNPNCRGVGTTNQANIMEK